MIGHTKIVFFWNFCLQTTSSESEDDDDEDSDILEEDSKACKHVAPAKPDTRKKGRKSKRKEPYVGKYVQSSPEKMGLKNLRRRCKHCKKDIAHDELWWGVCSKYDSNRPRNPFYCNKCHDNGHMPKLQATT